MADETEESKTEETEAPAEAAAPEEAAAEPDAAEGAAEEAPAEDAAEAEGEGGDDWGAAMAEQGAGEAEAAAAEPETAVEPTPAPVPVAQPRPAASFDQLRSEAAGKGISNLELILDIPVTISVELGRTELYIKDLISLGQGAVMELDKMAGDPMEIFVNGHLVAKGETVVVNDKFGVKLTDIVSPTERITNLV